MEDKILLMEIFKRLGKSFYNDERLFVSDGCLCTITDSETAANALEETLFNIGLNNNYERINKINSIGVWEAKFILK